MAKTKFLKLKVLTSLVCINFLYANVSISDEQMFQNNIELNKQESQQRDINTKKDYKDFVELMEKAIKLGDKSKLYVLGLLYEKNFDLKDGKISADLNKAKYYFNEALLNDFPIAAYNLATIEFAEDSNHNALLTIEKGLSLKSATPELKEVLSNFYAVIVVEKNLNDKNVLSNAINLVKEFADKNRPNSQFLLAHLYLRHGLEDSANKYLNLACHNPTAQDNLKQFCAYGEHIGMITKDGKDVKKDNSNCTTCGNN